MKNLLLFLILSVILASCSEQDLNDYIADNILYNLSISSESVFASPIDENHTIKINTNTEWSAQTSEEWIVLENVNGTSNGELRFETKANPLANTREGKIGIYCFGKHKKDIIVKQSNVSLTLKEEYIEFGSNESSQKISFETIGQWKVSSPDEWLSISPKEGFGNSTITIDVAELFSGKDRTGSIIIMDQSSQEKEIKIIQKGKYLNIDKKFISFLASGDNQQIINVSTDGEIQFSCEDWIQCKEANKILSLKAEENNSGLTKRGSLKLKIKDVEDLETLLIDIHQAPVKTTAKIVDLGLSVKWSSYNIGATNEKEMGIRYLYGEGPDFSYDWFDIPYDLLPNNVIGTQYDTAHAFWGGNWRTPTEKECGELMTNCKIELVSWNLESGANYEIIELYNEKTDKSARYINMCEGYKFTSIINGNSIILPKAENWYYWIPYQSQNDNGIQISYHFGYRIASKGLFVIWGLDDFNIGNGVSYTNFSTIRAVWDE